jgi:hypothetical protein
LCTLVAIHRVVSGAPLVVAANRDEYYERPAEGPALRVFHSEIGAEAPLVAPLDVRAGGTWLAVSPTGVFGAVTNLRCTNPDPTRLSRGGVVPRALRESSAAGAAEVLKALPEGAYNPFQCFVADPQRAFLLSYRDVPRVRELGRGVHVVGNLDPEEEPAPKVERVRAAAEAAVRAAPNDVLEGLSRLCSEHGTGGGGTGDTCVHLDGYGTKSSTLIQLADDPASSRLRFAASAPCETAHENFDVLLSSALSSAGTLTGSAGSQSDFLQLSSESSAGWRTAPESLAVRNPS